MTYERYGKQMLNDLLVFAGKSRENQIIEEKTNVPC